MTDSQEKHEVVESKFLRTTLIIAGTFFLVLGLIGIVLPILPTTPFLLLAASCYARSSRKFYTWLMNNRVFGQYIRNYREGKGIPLKVKILSISILWVAIVISIFLIDNFLVRTILILIAVGVTIHISTIKTLNQQ